MQSKSSRRPTPALIVAIIALVAALAGTAVALPGKSSVKKNDIAKNAVVSKAIKNDKVTGKDVNESKLGQVPSAARANSAAAVDTLQASGLKKLSAAGGAGYDAARAAAAEVPLLSKGPFSLVGKCFTDTTADVTHSEVYIKTTQAGAVFTGNQSAGLWGDPFLDPTTDEDDRWVSGTSTGNNSANGFRVIFDAVAPDGTLLNGHLTTYAKNGDLTGSEGVYGDGDTCLIGAVNLG